MGRVSQRMPAAIDQFRTQAAAATGICQPGRCRTTAIALAFGQGCDPAARFAREQVGSWLVLWNDCPDLRADIRAAWVYYNGRVFGEQWPGWNKVTGPMTATMAALHMYGWKARCPDLWMVLVGRTAIVSDSGITPSPPTKSFDFRGFDSSRLLILKGGNSHVRIIL